VVIVTEPSGTHAILEIIERLAQERGRFTSDDIRPFLPATATPRQIPSAAEQARRLGIIEEVGREKSKIPTRKGSLVAIYRPGPLLGKPVPAPPEGMPADHIEEITALRVYLEQRGYLISEADLASLLLLSASRGWTLLAGPSGTGKSSIVRLLAEAFQGAFADVQVKRYWTGSDEVLGYYSETAQEWVPGPLYLALIEAEGGGSLHFVRLDEMNLAPPEYYAAELLSAGEAWKTEGGQVVSAGIQLPPVPPDKAPEAPRLTNAVVLFGTLNVDETTQPLSPKMLDRSAVISFDQVDFASLPQVEETPDPPPLERLTKMFLERPRDLLMLGDQLDPEALDQVTPLLTGIDGYTMPIGYPLGYRQRDGLLIALSLWKSMGLGEILSQDAVIDAGVRSMILPKLQGSAPGMAEYLRGLAGVLIGDESPAEEDIDSLRERLADARYPRSIEKIISMIEQLTTLGYFGFW
jgi:MoxR-like ATPase